MSDVGLTGKICIVRRLVCASFIHEYDICFAKEMTLIQLWIDYRSVVCEPYVSGFCQFTDETHANACSVST